MGKRSRLHKQGVIAGTESPYRQPYIVDITGYDPRVSMRYAMSKISRDVTGFILDGKAITRDEIIKRGESKVAEDDKILAKRLGIINAKVDEPPKLDDKEEEPK